MSSWNSSSFSMPKNQEKKQIPRYEAPFTNKNYPFMWLVCKTRAKILLSDPETSVTTPRLLPSWGDRDGHMETSNRPSRPDRLEIFWNDWGTIRTIMWKPGLKGVSCRFWFNTRCLGRTLFLPIQISPTVVLKEISIWKKKIYQTNKQTVIQCYCMVALHATPNLVTLSKILTEGVEKTRSNRLKFRLRHVYPVDNCVKGLQHFFALWWARNNLRVSFPLFRESSFNMTRGVRTG